MVKIKQMTTTLKDMQNGNSKCCDAPIYLGICSDCKEHSEPKKYDCEDCQDTGYVDCDYLNDDHHWERGTDTQKCNNPIHIDDEDHYE